MLSADLLSRCPRCKAVTAPSDETCSACRCDLSIERQAYAQLAPSIAELRFIFAAVLVINGIIAYLAYSEASRFGLPTTTIAATGAVVCGVMAALWFAAPRTPLAAALIGLAIFGGKWAYDIAQDPDTLHINPGFAMRVVIVLAFVFAVRAGLTVRRMRLTTASPSASA